ncbi:MAG: hypothetical protein R3194_01740 [Limnobacter sp.]|nr:hypothetical protein [Limnobacter sp.]
MANDNRIQQRELSNRNLREVDRFKERSFQQPEHGGLSTHKPRVAGGSSRLLPGELPEKPDLNQPDSQSMGQSFLAMLQNDPVVEATGKSALAGANKSNKSEANEKRTAVSELEIDFKDFGKSDVKVVQTGDSYKVSINLRDKSKIPSNPLLFKQIIEKELSATLGAQIRIELL